MGHDLVFYILLLLAVLWLCMVLSWLWPQSRAATSQLQPTATKRAKTPTKAQKPFDGLTRKPLCQACQHAAETRQQAPGTLPLLLMCTRGRRRTIDTQQHFCPDHDCSYYGWVGRGNIRGNGHPGGRPWRQTPARRVPHLLPRDSRHAIARQARATRTARVGGGRSGGGLGHPGRGAGVRG
jgi:hypothetical protein